MALQSGVVALPELGLSLPLLLEIMSHQLASWCARFYAISTSLNDEVLLQGSWLLLPVCVTSL